MRKQMLNNQSVAIDLGVRIPGRDVVATIRELGEHFSPQQIVHIAYKGVLLQRLVVEFIERAADAAGVSGQSTKPTMRKIRALIRQFNIEKYYGVRAESRHIIDNVYRSLLQEIRQDSFKFYFSVSNLLKKSYPQLPAYEYPTYLTMAILTAEVLRNSELEVQALHRRVMGYGCGTATLDVTDELILMCRRMARPFAVVPDQHCINAQRIINNTIDAIQYDVEI